MRCIIIHQYELNPYFLFICAHRANNEDAAVAVVARNGIPLCTNQGRLSSSASIPPSLTSNMKVVNGASRNRTSGISDTSAQDLGNIDTESEYGAGGRMRSAHSSGANESSSAETAREDDHSENVIFLDHSNEPFPHSITPSISGEDDVPLGKEKSGDKKVEDINWIIGRQSSEIAIESNQSSAATQNTQTLSVRPAFRSKNTSGNIPGSIPRDISASFLSTASVSGAGAGPNPRVGPSEQFFLLGRRNVLAYTLSSGYLLRDQGVTLELGGQQNRKESQNSNSDINSKEFSRNQKESKKSSSAAAYYNNLQKNGNKGKDRFSGGKLMFSTCYSEPCETRNKMQKNVNGRLPNFVCDFVVPLMTAGLIYVEGHVAFDVGCVGVFVDVCLSLHVMVSERFLSFTEETSYPVNSVTGGGGGGGGNDSNNSHGDSSSSSSSAPTSRSHDALQGKAGEDSRRELVAHASDLLLWCALSSSPSFLSLYLLPLSHSPSKITILTLF